jgi:hypothetical protein
MRNPRQASRRCLCIIGGRFKSRQVLHVSPEATSGRVVTAPFHRAGISASEGVSKSPWLSISISVRPSRVIFADSSRAVPVGQLAITNTLVGMLTVVGRRTGMRYKVRTLQRKRDHRASAVSLGRLWEMNHSSKCVSGTSRRISERPDTGGLTVAALVAHPTRRRKSPISQATHVEQPGAAGVSQPWFPKRNCTLIHGTLRRTLHLPTHGGLRSPLLVRVQLRIARDHFLGDRTRCNQERLA